MSKTLIVMRHSKSSWEHQGPDKDRPLNARGQSNAATLGNWLRAQNLSPDEVLCSSAARTQETTARLKLTIEPTLIDALYLASPDVLLKYVQRASGDTVLLVSHNPGIADFVESLAQHAPNHPRFLDYPTGATTVFSCDITDWSELNADSAAVQHFVIPRELS